MRKEDISRFWSKVNVKLSTHECWNWIATINYKGYGIFTINGTTINAHRFSYLLKNGKISHGLVIDHLCRNRKCVNPYHLEAVTNKENCQRGKTGITNKSKTHCPKGHPYSGDNLYIRKEGWRMCKKCGNMSYKKHRESDSYP